MRGFRAKDADRDRFVELIEAAYVDGQIGDADREFRIGRALAAETLDELQTLTRDLQLPPGYVPPAAPSSPPSRSVSVLSSGSRRAGGVLVGLVVLVALVVAGVTGIVALFFFASSGGEVATSTGVPSISAAPEVSVEEAEAPSLMSAGSVRAFLAAYEEQFGTGEAYEVTFLPDRIQAQVPVRGSRPRMERWTWNGEWRQDTTASAVTGPGQRVDSGAIDVRRMFANIGVAKRTLNVERGRFTHAILHQWPGEPTALNIYIGNEFNESGYLRTTPAGDVVRAFAYDA